MNDLWWIIPSLVAGICVGLILAVLLRKVPQLRAIDVDALPEEKAKKLKESLLVKRFQRLAGKRTEKIVDVAVAVGSAASRSGRRLVQRVYKMEQYYRKLQKGMTGAGHATDEGAIKRLMEEAADLTAKEEYFQAEKRYIEIISHNPKHTKAYEELGNLYLLDRKYAQARETLTFASKLDPNDASVQVSLGELDLKDGNPPNAVKRFAKAIELRPHNPKYLDFFIEAALTAKNSGEATRGLGLLREVNPENKKLEEFATRIEEIGKGSEASTEAAE